MSAKADSAELEGKSAEADQRAPVLPTFREVFDAHAPYVWRTLRRLGVRDADAHDMCQEVFVVVHRRLSAFDSSSSMRTWVYGITLRVASQYRRRAHHHREEITSEVPEGRVPPPQEDAFEKRQLLDRLSKALDLLDESKRAVFVLYELEELTMNEVAEVLGCPLQTAYSRLRAARDIVKEAFARAPEPGKRP